VPESVTWYDVLGVAPGASAVTLRRAHEERLLQLRSFLTPPVPVPVGSASAASALTPAGPSPVASAASRAAAAVDEAWLVLGDPEQRRRYDTQLAVRLPQRRRRRLTVPDVRGLFYRSSQTVAATAGLRLAVIRLTGDPLPVEGLVIGQSPDPGETVRRRSTLTIQVWHPARSQ
jgi:curved DNA-binding protein CbpA